MREDAERWNARYEQTRNEQIAPTEPSAPKGLDPNRPPTGAECLDVACGAGAQSVWAALHGFRVTALDVSDVAIEMAAALADRHGVRDRIEFRATDLDAGLPTDCRDRFALVVCQRFRGTDLYPQLAAAAAPGATIVVTVLSRVGLGGEGGPFHAPPGELVLAFRGLGVEVVSSIETDGEATLVARRPGP